MDPLAEEDVSKILQSLGLSELVDRFLENGVNMEVLKKMNENDFKSLIPEFGKRVLVRDCIDKLKMEDSNCSDHTVVMDDETSIGVEAKLEPVLERGLPVHENYLQIGGVGVQYVSQLNSGSVPDASSEPDAGSWQYEMGSQHQQWATQQHQECATQQQQGRDGREQEGRDGREQEGRDGQEQEGRDGQEQEGRDGREEEGRDGREQEGRDGREQPSRTPQPKTLGMKRPRQPSKFFLNGLTLEEYLMGNSKTRCILDTYNKSSRLSSLKNDQRTRLVDAIMTGLLDRHESVKSPLLQELAEEITKIFPTEDSNIYFCPVSGQSKIPRGKLYVKYNNTMSRRRTATKASTNAETSVPEVEKDEIVAKNWLCFGREPWSEVTLNWDRSFKLRRQDVKSQTTSELIEDWPVLRHPKGFTLVS